MRVALITGVNGQDGSYLSEFLLEKGYVVWGMIRRTSSINTERINHLYEYNSDKFILKYGDLSDSSNILKILYEINANHQDMERLEIYNLAAMSHVKISFEIPEYTGNIDGLGTLRILEAILNCGYTDKIRFYQASTSELYGKVVETPQSETTPFYPRSPYGVAKLYAYWIVKNYRESHGLFACNGILFNHETLAGFMPLIFKQNNVINIKPISEIVKYHTRKNGILVDENNKTYQQGEVDTNLEVWDNSNWTNVKFASGYPHDIKNDNKKPRFIISKNSAYFTTSNHEIIMEDNSEKKTSDIILGDKVKLVTLPNNDEYTTPNLIESNNTLECKYCNHIFGRKYGYKKHIDTGNCKDIHNYMICQVTNDEAILLGLLVGDGYKNRFTNKSHELIEYTSKLWNNICEKHNRKGTINKRQIVSGFNKNEKIYQITLNGFGTFFNKYIMYNEDKTKRIPVQILNSRKEIKLSFLTGYNRADGLKKNKCIYEFKNFKTNSACLAQGLIYLIQNTTMQQFNVNVEFENRWGKNRLYYSINLLSNSKYSQSNSIDKHELIIELLEKNYSQRQINRDTGISRTFIRKVQNGYIPSTKHHYCISPNTVKKIIDYDDYDGWFYDLETQSGKFHAGIGLGRIHNSPRRGHNFVTRKITRGLGMILKKEEEKLVLGNIDALRDWGHAKDFVRGMWMMLQQDVTRRFRAGNG